MENHALIKRAILNTIVIKQQLLESQSFISLMESICKEIVTAFKNGKKLLVCGNGGSAADAQHIAAEFSGRFYIDRDPLFAEALHVNSSFLTAIANDYSYNQIYSRAVKAMGKEGDILIGISTSGNSKNIIEAIEAANAKKMITIGFTGEVGGNMKDACKYLIRVPSSDTPRIQESHILIGHIIAEIVEKELFAK